MYTVQKFSVCDTEQQDCGIIHCTRRPTIRNLTVYQISAE